mmetsp:Transcript_20414/g.65191  ORF Transcript_20414/g.65191 Transcript_20414/m.65191 type:complete len:239 (+) Transcript_20414:272-988(+)
MYRVALATGADEPVRALLVRATSGVAGECDARTCGVHRVAPRATAVPEDNRLHVKRGAWCCLTTAPEGQRSLPCRSCRASPPSNGGWSGSRTEGLAWASLSRFGNVACVPPECFPTSRGRTCPHRVGCGCAASRWRGGPGLMHHDVVHAPRVQVDRLNGGPFADAGCRAPLVPFPLPKVDERLLVRPWPGHEPYWNVIDVVATALGGSKIRAGPRPGRRRGTAALGGGRAWRRAAARR